MKKQNQEPEHPRFFTEKNGEFQLHKEEIINMLRCYYGVSSMKLITGETKCVVTTRGSIINVMEDDVAIVYIRNLLLKREEVVSLNNINLINKIKTTRIIDKSFIKNLIEIKMAYFYNKEDRIYEYLYYRNCAVCIKEESIECVDYEDLKFYVFAEQILPYDFTLIEDYPLKIYLPTHEKRLNTLVKSGEESDSKYIKFLRDISNVSWRKTNPTKEEKRINELSFFNKVMFLGYMLSHRQKDDEAKICLVGSLNTAMDINKEYYALGKSLLCKFLNYGAKGVTLECNSDTSIASAINSYVIPPFIIVEDAKNEDSLFLLHKEINEDTIIESFPKSHYVLKKEQSPNIAATTNNLNYKMGHSLKGRILEVTISDYYHTTKDNNARYPYCCMDLFETPIETLNEESGFESMANRLQRKELLKAIEFGPEEEQMQKLEALKELLKKEKQARDKQLKASDNSDKLNDLFNLLARCVQVYMLYTSDKNIYSIND